MPTPRDSTDDLPRRLDSSTHTSCPPDNPERHGAWGEDTLNQLQHVYTDVADSPPVSLRLESSPADRSSLTPTPPSDENRDDRITHGPRRGDRVEVPPPLMAASPQSSNDEEKESYRVRTTGITLSALNLSYSARYGIGSPRVSEVCLKNLSQILTVSQLRQFHSSCKFRAGSKYRGTQTSDQLRYKVEVDIKSVDMTESFVCGYLRIEGAYSTVQ